MRRHQANDSIVISSPASPAYWDRVLDAIPFPIYTVDTATYEILRVNRAMLARIGTARGKMCYEAIYGQDRPCFFCRNSALLQSTVEGYTLVFEHFNDADERWYQLQETLVRLGDGRVAKYSIAVDISVMKGIQNALAEAHAELAMKSHELERLSITDRLTGLYNRHKLDQVLDHESDRASRSGVSLSVILIDVDHFKRVNDSFGHRAGDKVLAEISGVLEKGIRRVDTVGRWGGEEFLIVCPDTEMAGATTLAEKLRYCIAEHRFSDSGSMTASFGVAQLIPGEATHKLLERADAALYRAKGGGRDRVERS